MSKYYSITPAEAITLKERLLNEPEFRQEFIEMDPVQDMVNDRLHSVRLQKTNAEYVRMKEENEQKIYEIVCFTLRKSPTDLDIVSEDEDFDEEKKTSEESIRLDKYFWSDV